ncbi:MAG: hypothetical protein WCF36_05690 [Candidatus Nanopelagicales bacterium]
MTSPVRAAAQQFVALDCVGVEQWGAEVVLGSAFRVGQLGGGDGP